LDSSLSCVDRMREKYEGVAGCTWVVGDAMQMESIGDESMELVLDKGTLDALACKDEGREEAGRSLIAEAFRVLRPGGSLVIASFGPPQIRWCVTRRSAGLFLEGIIRSRRAVLATTAHAGAHAGAGGWRWRLSLALAAGARAVAGGWRCRWQLALAAGAGGWRSRRAIAPGAGAVAGANISKLPWKNMAVVKTLLI
jgi:hypothetical protein